MSSLVVEHLRKTFPTPAEDLVVLQDVDLRLSAGESVAIVGPSGTGKSTLLQIIGTLDHPTSGTVRLSEVDPFSLGDKDLASFRNRNIGFVFQDHHLLPHLNVLQNVMVPGLATGSIHRDLQNRAVELLERVGLRDRLHHLPGELSGGERGRAAVARALLMKPTLILADEPTGNLDPTNAQKIATLLIELQQAEKAMMLVVTHSSDIAAQMQRCVRMDQGRLVAQ